MHGNYGKNYAAMHDREARMRRAEKAKAAIASMVACAIAAALALVLSTAPAKTAATVSQAANYGCGAC